MDLFTTDLLRQADLDNIFLKFDTVALFIFHDLILHSICKKKIICHVLDDSICHFSWVYFVALILFLVENSVRKQWRY